MFEYLHLMKSEAMVLLIIFILLFIKLGKGLHNDTLLSVVQLLLLCTESFHLDSMKRGGYSMVCSFTIP